MKLQIILILLINYSHYYYYYCVSGTTVTVQTIDNNGPRSVNNVKKFVLDTELTEVRQLTEISIEHPGVDVLDANSISNLPFLNLIVIRHAITQLLPLTFVNLPKIDKIKITFNALSLIPTNCFQDLKVETIDLSNNNISTIENKAFNKLKRLTKIKLSSNRLIVWNSKAFQMVTNLQYINLNENKIEQLNDDAFVNLKSLRKIMLINNRLKNIGLILNGLNYVDDLYLQQNFLKTLPENLFAPYFKPYGFPANVHIKRQFSTLDISLNHLSYLSDKMMDDLNLIKAINIQLNPWNCNCQRKIEIWTKNNLIKLNPYESMCVNPQDAICIVPINDDRSCKILNDSDVQHFFSLLHPHCEFYER